MCDQDHCPFNIHKLHLILLTWLPHCKYRSHCPHSVLTYRSGIAAYVPKHCLLQHLLHKLLPFKCQKICQNVHICHICLMSISGMYLHKCVTYKVTGINWHKKLKRYGCHIVYIYQTSLILYRHIDPILLCIHPKHNQLQHLLTAYLHICAKTYMATKLQIGHIYKYFTCIYSGYISIYVPHLKSLASTMSPKVLYTSEKNHQ